MKINNLNFYKKKTIKISLSIKKKRHIYYFSLQVSFSDSFNHYEYLPQIT